MAKVTQEQLDRWNAKLQNGFTIDLHSLLYHNEKMPVKYVELGEGKRIAAKLMYREHREDGRYTGQQQPTLHLSIWRDSGSSGMMSSSGLGVFMNIGTLQNKRNFNELAKLTGTIDEEYILVLASEKMVQLKNDRIL